MNSVLRLLTWMFSLSLLFAVSPDLEAKKKSKNKDYEVKFGMMAYTPEGMPFVYTETRHIEKAVGKGDPHGFSVKRKDGNQFFCHYSIRFPVPLPEITDAMRDYFTIKEGGRVLESPDKMYWSYHAESFHFSESDPTGEFELTIYVDQEPYQVIKYDVVEFKGIGF